MSSRVWNEATEAFAEKLGSWGEGFVRMLPNLTVALVGLIAFWLLAKLVRLITRRLLNRVAGAKATTALFSNLAYIAVMLLGVVVALGVLNLEKTVTSMLAGIGVIGLALGFAFQDLAANFVSGVMMSFREPFGPGDYIETNGLSGTVEFIHLRTTVIRAFSGERIEIPNRKIFSEPLKNYSANGRRRVEIAVGVGYEEDLEKVKEIAKNAIEPLSMRDTSRDVDVLFREFGDSSVNFDLHFWIQYPEVNFLKARDAGVLAIRRAFDEKEITIPFPIRTLDIGIEEGRALRQELEAT